jgi:hypothetical protein
VLIRKAETLVIAGLDPAIHGENVQDASTAGPSPGVTVVVN